MKRICVFLLLLAILAAQVTLYAAEDPPAQPAPEVSEEDRKVAELLELLELMELLDHLEDVAALEENS